MAVKFSNIMYVLLLGYCTYVLLSGYVDKYYEPTIEMTNINHIYSLLRVNSYSNKFQILSHIKFERKLNLCIFIFNTSINNTTIDDNINDHELNLEYENIYYGVYMSQDVNSNLKLINSLLEDNNITINSIEFYEETESIINMFSFNTMMYYFVLLNIINIVVKIMNISNITNEDTFFHITNMNDFAQSKIKFSDVIGLTEPKQLLTKYVSMLKNRDKYLNMGANLPRGLLLSGPPGCGKTLIAKAIAGEAGVSFISVCGSDFDEMFVGVGSSRVKKLFEYARNNNPCVIFIDEIDSIGVKRHGFNQTNTATLNKILSEMDGFKTQENILVIASTNRIDTLDNALLRSGRFDAKVTIDLPTKQERCDMFHYYLQKNKFQPTELIIKKLSDMTPNVSGADIANICNQAAINTVFDDKPLISEEYLINAIDDILIGIEKKYNNKSEQNLSLKVTAYHEAGHALIGFMIKDAPSPVKVSIIPRGDSVAGYTIPYDAELKNMTKGQLEGSIMCLLGGRCAEIVKFGNLTTGASNDFEKATKLLEIMITKYGMFDNEFGCISYDINKKSPRCVSDKTLYEIEVFMKTYMEKLVDCVTQILRGHIEQLELISLNLLEKELIDYSDIKNMISEYENKY